MITKEGYEEYEDEYEETGFEPGDVVSWSDLNDSQKNYAVDHAYEYESLHWIWEFYDEGTMDWYYDRKNEIIEEYESRGLDINGDNIYWQSNSHGPYPEWDLRRVIDDISVETDDAEADITFYGKSTDVLYEIDLYYFDEEEQDFIYEYSIEDIDELNDPKYHLTPEFISEVKSKIELADNFIDEIWGLVYDVCTAYPDDEWIYTELENDDGEYEIIDEYRAKPYNFRRW